MLSKVVRSKRSKPVEAERTRWGTAKRRTITPCCFS